jgi:hypothetical protein
VCLDECLYINSFGSANYARSLRTEVRCELNDAECKSLKSSVYMSSFSLWPIFSVLTIVPPEM